MIGFDIQEVKRVKNEDKLIAKIALPGEIAYIEKFAKQKKEKIASLWAVKEAMFKTLDINAGDISYKEIELCHKENGAPYIKLYGKAKKRFDELKMKEIEVSISNQQSIVGAVVVLR